VSRVVLMCGAAGAGKSTVARRLEETGKVRLSIDQEAWNRGIRSDVVVDFSFWSRRSRDEYRNVLKPLGVQAETIYLATPREVVLERMRARRIEHGDDFTLTDEIAAENFDHFEPPIIDGLDR
jgi:predicted kinase